jgi:hypothetical protein
VAEDGYFERLFENEQLDKLKMEGKYYEEADEEMPNELIEKESQTMGQTQDLREIDAEFE